MTTPQRWQEIDRMFAAELNFARAACGFLIEPSRAMRSYAKRLSLSLPVPYRIKKVCVRKWEEDLSESSPWKRSL